MCIRGWCPTGVQFVLSLLFLLADLLDGPGQVYSLEFGGVLGDFPLHIFKVHLQRYKRLQEDEQMQRQETQCTAAH